jgi:PncC family amidohydrolase
MADGNGLDIVSLFGLAERVGARLKERNETIAIAESSAGGLISAALLAVPGASAYYVGGSVVYTRTAKEGLLNLTDAQLDSPRASTEGHAAILARGARELLGTTWGLGETGATGPTGNRYGDAAGHVCLGVDGPAQLTVTIETASADRHANMLAFATAALELLDEALQRKV